MGNIVGAVATSHAFTFLPPAEWENFRAINRESFRRRRGFEAPIQLGIEAETAVEVERRFRRIREAHEALRAQIIAAQPDVLIVIGDDQNENLTSRNMPQIAVYTGGAFGLNDRFAKTKAHYRTHDAFASAVVYRGVESDFDLATLGAFDCDELRAHAHAQVLDAFLPDAAVPVVLIFLNAIHHPAITPRRCFALGTLLRQVIVERPAAERAMICASGGLSHFTAGYPWTHYRGPFSYGAISQDFDRRVLAHIANGEGSALADFSSDDLMANGDIELRAWIALLGAVGPVPARFAVYEPFYRALMGMAVASWPAAT